MRVAHFYRLLRKNFLRFVPEPGNIMENLILVISHIQAVNGTISLAIQVLESAFTCNDRIYPQYLDADSSRETCESSCDRS